MPWTYIVECADGSFYVGSTVDLAARIAQHNSPAEGAMYTRHRQPVTLVWSTQFDRIDEAFAYEKRIQGWSRRKREALIRGDFEALPRLSRRAGVQRREGGFEAPR